MADDAWLRCSACKTDIFFGMRQWVCSVSTCNRNRMRLVFCSVACWDSHLADANHREAWAVEARAPSRAEWEAENAPAAPAAPRKVISTAPAPAPAPAGGPALADGVEREIL